MGKRGAAPGSPMRKLRKTDPAVKKNLGKVEEALYDSAVEVPGSKANRKMLIEALPRALGDGAASDERHGYQTLIVDAIGEVLSAEVKKLTEKVAASQAEYDEVTAAKAVKDGALAEKQATLNAKKAEIDEKKNTHSTDKQAQKDAEHALVEANDAVAHFDENMVKKGVEKTKYEAALNETLASLKKGEYENAKAKKAAVGKGLEALKGLLATAGADDSLLLCFPAALQKEPEKRGQFDNTVIGEVESRMNKMIAGLASELAEGPSTKDKKVAEAQEAVGKKDAAIAQQEASAEALRVAESEKPELDTAAKGAASEVKDAAKIQDAKAKVLAKDQAALENATNNAEALKFLQERSSIVPEEPKEDAPMEEAPAPEA